MSVKAVQDGRDGCANMSCCSGLAQTTHKMYSMEGQFSSQWSSRSLKIIQGKAHVISIILTHICIILYTCIVIFILAAVTKWLIQNR